MEKHPLSSQLFKKFSLRFLFVLMGQRPDTDVIWAFFFIFTIAYTSAFFSLALMEELKMGTQKFHFNYQKCALLKK
jgi:hypothetical protein